MLPIKSVIEEKSPYSLYSKEDYKKRFNAIDVPKGFSYDSGNNTEWETVESLRDLVKLHVDSNFKVKWNQYHMEDKRSNKMISMLL